MSVEERRRPTPGDPASPPPHRALEEWIASAERIRTSLEHQVAEARARMAEAEAKAATGSLPTLAERLGAIVIEAEQQAELERARVDQAAAGGAASVGQP